MQVASQVTLDRKYRESPWRGTATGNAMVSRDWVELMSGGGFDAVRIPLSWDQYAQPENREDQCRLTQSNETVSRTPRLR